MGRDSLRGPCRVGIKEGAWGKECERREMQVGASVREEEEVAPLATNSGWDATHRGLFK